MRKARLLFFLICLLIPFQLLAGTVYYVATNGSDVYNGLFPSYQGGSDGPFRTLGKAAASVQPGDTVKIRGGIYREASTWGTDGTPSLPITVTNFNSETVVIDGNNHAIPASDYACLMRIKGDWYTVSNLEISYAGWYGIAAEGTHCTFRNIYCHHTWAAGINLWGPYGLVDGCRAYYNSQRYEFGVGENWSTSISIMGPNADHCTIRNSVAWDTWGQGIKIAKSSYSTIEDCVAYNNWYNYYVRDSHYCLVQRNISYNTEGNLIQPYVRSQVTYLIGDETAPPSSSDNTFINNFGMGGRFVISIGSGTMENCLYAHNTFVNASPYYADTRYAVKINKGAYTNARFMNNIILQEDFLPIALNGSSGISFGYNNWSKTPPSNCQGTADIIANPLLAKTGPAAPGSLTAAWFKILAGSPARDRAQVLSRVTQDFFKTPRGNQPDMGAHEFTGGSSPLAASATGSPTTGQAPLSVNFTGSASGGTTPYSFRWTFGDGASSASQNPSHTYLLEGSYTATLTVTDNMNVTASQSVSITATASVLPLAASASAAPTSGQAPLSVNFSGTASGGTPPYAFRWTFGDGSSSTTQNPSHTYGSAGSYVATLTVTDNASSTAGHSVTIQVTSALSQLVAEATASPTSGPVPLLVSFTGNATGGALPYVYHWDFGDGATSIVQNPSHTYSTAGTFTVVLTIHDALSASASASLNVSAQSGSTARLDLAARTGAPAPGQGGTTDPSPGTHAFSLGSLVQVTSIPHPDYRFSKWEGDVAESSMFHAGITLTMDGDKSLSSLFCTQCGDVNGDLKITPADAQVTFDIYLGRIASPTWCELENADVNASGTKLVPKITPADAQTLFKKYLKKGSAALDCSGDSRSPAAASANLADPGARLSISSNTLLQDGYISIPIIIESPSVIGAFGFDLAFPSGQWTYVGLERTAVTEDFNVLDANVIPSFRSPDESGLAQMDRSILRVGGYRTDLTENPSSGVLITLIFKVAGRVRDENPTKIVAAYDDIRHALIKDNTPESEDRGAARETRQEDPEKRSPGKRHDIRERD